jgi:hypothetical protein
MDLSSSSRSHHYTAGIGKQRVIERIRGARGVVQGYCGQQADPTKPTTLGPLQPTHLPCPFHVQELSSFLSLRTTTELVVDRSAQNELLKVTFNVRCAAVTVQPQLLLVVSSGLCP